MTMNEREVGWNTTFAEVNLAPSPSTPSSSSLSSPHPHEFYPTGNVPANPSTSPHPSLSQASFFSSPSPLSSSSLASSSSSSSPSTHPPSSPSNNAPSPSPSTLPSSSHQSSSSSSSSSSSTPSTSSSSSSSSSTSSSTSSSSSKRPHPNPNPSNPDTPLTPPPTPPTLLSPCQMTFREAVQNGDTMELLRLLEEREGKINVNLFDKEGQTALHHSCLKGNLELVKLLVRFGADVTLANRDGWHPLHLAASGGHSDILIYLLTVPRHHRS